MAEQILSMTNIVKTYKMGEEDQTVLKGINFELNSGEFVSLLGPSGSGKSTLMNILGCLDVPTSGTYSLGGNQVETLDERDLAQVRNSEIGFVFQQFQLLPRLTALQNVELPLIYSGIPEKQRKQMAKEMLTKVGLSDKLKNRPNQLSGGQQQRVAIARALVTHPTILLADEPTGALDQKTGQQIMELFKELHNEGRTIVMITHDEKIAQHGSRIVKILDGMLIETSNSTEENQEVNEYHQPIHLENSRKTGEPLEELFKAIGTILKDENMLESVVSGVKLIGEKMRNNEIQEAQKDV